MLILKPRRKQFASNVFACPTKEGLKKLSQPAQVKHETVSLLLAMTLEKNKATEKAQTNSG